MSRLAKFRHDRVIFTMVLVGLICDVITLCAQWLTRGVVDPSLSGLSIITLAYFWIFVAQTNL